MNILNTTIESNKTYNLDFNSILPKHLRSNSKLNVTIYKSNISGPTVLIIGGMHSNELNGIKIVQTIINKKLNIPLRGTIISIPILNSVGTKRNYMSEDLNRVFPGNKNGTNAEQFVYYFMKHIFSHVDYCLDFHTGNDKFFNIPQIRTNIDTNLTNSKYTIKFPIIQNSLRHIGMQLNKLVFVFEGGTDKSINQYAIKSGIISYLNLLNSLQMIKYESNTPTIKIDTVKIIKSPISGNVSILASKYKLRKGDEIYKIENSVETQIIKAPFDCYILGINLSKTIKQNKTLLKLGN